MELRHGGIHLGAAHVLDAILELRPPDPAAELLARLGVDPERARERLAA